MKKLYISASTNIILMCERMTPCQPALSTRIENKRICACPSADDPVSYKSDAEVSEDALMQGMMEISAISLPDEPHKYYRSH